MPFFTQLFPISRQQHQSLMSLGTHIFLLTLLLFLTACGGASAPTVPGHPASPSSVPAHKPVVYVAGRALANTAVLTSKDDNWRSGQSSHEILLNTGNVNVSHFGKRISYPVDGQVYAQPLFMPNLIIHGRKHDVVFVATEHDSVFALDADQPTEPLWQVSFINPAQGITPLTPADVGGCGDIGPEIGITGTPVIDTATATLYVVAITKEEGRFVQRLHALDITTGQEKNGGPVTIQATVQGTGDASSEGIINFDPLVENQRSALLLANGIVFVAWASYCDRGLYHGWILGYQASSLKQAVVYNDTPDGYQGGIWQSGGGIAADDQNNLYVATGNGTYNLNSGGDDAGDSLLKLSIQSPELEVEDYFTPFNQECLGYPNDTDLGSGGTLLFPDAHRLVNVGKEGRVYVMDQDHLGEYSTIDDPCQHQDRTDVDDIVQELPPGTVAGGLYSSPVSWESANGTYLYMSGANDHLKAFLFNQDSLQLASQTSARFTFPGANSSLSSDGKRSGTGILWVLDSQSILRAYDASDLTRELYATDENPARDAFSGYVKFSVPTVANGEVFVGTRNSLLIYGLLD